MARYRIDLGYRGTEFHGWAAQPGLRTVQGVLQQGLERITRVDSAQLGLTVAGRTDAGVHARHQVAHIDLPPAAEAKIQGRRSSSVGAALCSRLNGVLRGLDASDIVIHDARRVSEDFDARFSALWREYSYRICDIGSFRDPLHAHMQTHINQVLDTAVMHAEAHTILGLRDFLAVSKPRPGATTIRTLLRLTVERDEAGVVCICVRADAFCHHMVRALVGALVRVGNGTWLPGVLARLIPAAREPRMDGESTVERAVNCVVGDEPAVYIAQPMHVFPAHGLTLEAIGYPDPTEWAARNTQTRAKRSS